MSMNIGDLNLGVKVDSKQLDSLSSKIGNFGKIAAKGVVAAGAAATAAATAIVKAASNTAKLGDEVDKNSQKLGLSAKAYQKWRVVLEHSGTSIDKMGISFKTLSKAVETTTDKQAAAFSKLGMSVEDLKNMAPEQQFQSVVEALQGMEEGSERTAIAMELLGSSASELGPLFNTSTEEMKKMLDQTATMSNKAVKDSAAYEDAITDLNNEVRTFTNEVIARVLPTITNIVNVLTKLFKNISSNLGVVDKFVASWKGMDVATSKASSNLKKLDKALASSNSKFKEGISAANGNAAAIKSIYSEIQKVIESENIQGDKTAVVNELLEQLNELAPGLNASYNEYANTLSITNQELEKYITNLKETAIAEAYAEKAKELASIYADQSIEVYNLKEAQQELGDRYETATRKLEAMTQGTRAFDQAEFDAIQMEKDAAEYALRQNDAELKLAEEGLAQTEQELEKTTAAQSNLNSTQAEATTTASQLAQAEYEVSQATADATDALANSYDSIISKYGESKTGINEVIAAKKEEIATGKEVNASYDDMVTKLGDVAEEEGWSEEKLDEYLGAAQQLVNDNPEVLKALDEGDAGWAKLYAAILLAKEEMDMEEEWRSKVQSAWTTLTKSIADQAVEDFGRFTDACTAALQAAESAQKASTITQGNKVPNRNGLEYIPEDGYVAELHRGERVLTREEAENYPQSSAPVYQPIYNITVPSNENAMATALKLRRLTRNEEYGLR